MTIRKDDVHIQWQMIRRKLLSKQPPWYQSSLQSQRCTLISLDKYRAPPPSDMRRNQVHKCWIQRPRLPYATTCEKNSMACKFVYFWSLSCKTSRAILPRDKRSHTDWLIMSLRGMVGKFGFPPEKSKDGIIMTDSSMSK